MSDNQKQNKQEEQMDSREVRRKRRKRNQIVAYLLMFLLLAGVITGGTFGVRALRKTADKIEKEKQTETAHEESTLQMEETESSEPVIVEEETPEELLNEVVESCISQMSLEDKVAGLFVITPEALTGVDTVVKAGDGTKEALTKYPVGGLIYFKKNIQSESQITEMLSNTTAMSKYPIFLAVDEEGGDVARVAEALNLETATKASEIGESKDTQEAYSAYQSIGTYLSKYGFNLDFAPVCDVLTNEDNTTIKTRSFGSDSKLVSDMVASSVKGLQETGVTACLKHFPGLGDADADTHSGLAVTKRTKAEMTETELKPFESGIAAGAQIVMAGHISVPEVTGDNTPASLSKEWMTDTLRGEMQYEGVIITDALNMGAITEYYTSEEACVKALKAGADMLLMPQDFTEAYEGVLAAVKDGTISEERINDSLARVYRIKYASTIEE